MKKTSLLLALVLSLLLLAACQLTEPTIQNNGKNPPNSTTIKPVDPDCEHSAVEDLAVAPTCTAEGLTQGFHCEKCGYVIIPQKPVEKLAHSIVTDKAVAPGCTATGLTEGSHCSVCNTVFVAQETISATGHTAVTDKAVSPTCAKEGKTEGSHCSKCNEVLVAQQSIAKLAHQYTETEVAATCGEDGYTLHKCHCGYSYKDNFVSMTYQHIFPKAIENPNLQYHYDDTCSVCGLRVKQHGVWIGWIGCNLSRPGTRYYVTETEFVCYGSGQIPSYYTLEGSDFTPQPAWFSSFDGEDSTITKLIIAPGITHIGDYSFGVPYDKYSDIYFGDKITEVYIADSVTYIGSGAFKRFDNVKKLYMSKNVTYIGNYNF